MNAHDDSMPPYRNKCKFIITDEEDALKNMAYALIKEHDIPPIIGDDDDYDVLVANNIEEHRTHPYTPQENGKIERWWETIERAKQADKKLEGDYLDWIVSQYNTRWEHNYHKKYLKKNWTPQEEWDNEEKYQGQEDAIFIYDEVKEKKEEIKNMKKSMIRKKF